MVVCYYMVPQSSGGRSSPNDISNSPRLFLLTPLSRKVHRLRVAHLVANQHASDDQKKVTHNTFRRTHDASGTSLTAIRGQHSTCITSTGGMVRVRHCDIVFVTRVF
jgi:hypothetical protein